MLKVHLLTERLGGKNQCYLHKNNKYEDMRKQTDKQVNEEDKYRQTWINVPPIRRHCQKDFFPMTPPFYLSSLFGNIYRFKKR